MKVEKQIYDHANSSNELKVGDILVFDSNTKNKMYEQVYNSKYSLNNMDANEIIINKKRERTTNFSLEELILLANTINNDAFVLRELALEEIRKQKYSNYPSRLSCLYLSKEIDEAKEWVNILKRNKKECKQVITFEVTGEVYSFDGNLMLRQNISYQELLDKADIYCNSNGSEILFLGEAKVIKIDNI